MLPAMNTVLRKNLKTHNAFSVPDERMIVQPKLDGIFFKLNRETMTGLTKDGKSYEATRIFGNRAPISKYIKNDYGELVYVDKNGLPTRERHKVMIVLRQQKGWEEYVNDIKYFRFNVDLTSDLVDSIKRSNSVMTYKEVIDKYLSHLSMMGSYSNIDEVRSGTAYASEIEEYFKLFTAYHSGPMEGLVVIKSNAVHHQFFGDKLPNYHPDFFKIKNSYDASLRCVGFKPHSKNKEWIGALICETSDGVMRIPIGMGLSKSDRQTPIAEFLGKTIEIEFEDLHIEEKALVSARVKYIRQDTEPDTFEKLIRRMRK